MNIQFRQNLFKDKTNKELQRITAASILLLMLVAASAQWTWNSWHQANVWKLMPDQSIAVVHIAETDSLIQQLEKSTFWKNLSGTASIGKAPNQLDSLLAFTQRDSIYQADFKKEGFYLSFQGKGAIGSAWTFYKQISPFTSLEHVTSVLKRWHPEGRITYRDYENHPLVDLQWKNTTFTVSIVKDQLVASFDAVWVETAIRHAYNRFNEDEHDLLNIHDRFQEIQADEDYLKSYINPQALHQFIIRITDYSQSFPQHFIPLNQVASGFQVQEVKDVQGLYFSSKYTPNEEGPYHQILKGQKASLPHYASMISEKTSAMMRMSITETDIFRKNLRDWAQKHDPKLYEQIKELRHWDFDLETFYALLNQEVIQSNFVSREYLQNHYISMLDLNKPSVGIQMLHDLSTHLAKEKGSSLFQTTYLDREIGAIHLQDFPARLLGPNFKHQGSITYFTSYKGYILFSDDLQTLKQWLEDQKAHLTWENNGKFKGVSHTSTPSLLSFIMDVPNSWDMMQERLLPNWKEYFIRNKSHLAQINFFQWHIHEDNFIASLLYKDNLFKDKQEFTLQPIFQTDISSKVHTSSKVIHVGKEPLWLTQNIAQVVYALDGSGEKRWAKPVNGKITAFQDVSFDNERIVFGAGNELYQLNASGKDLAFSPKKLPPYVQFTHVLKFPIQSLKSYGILALDTLGEAYIFDARGRSLFLNNPLKLLEASKSLPQHISIGLDDYLVVVSEMGKVSAFDYQGRYLKGFPILLQKPVSSSFYMKEGANKSTSIISILSDDGELIEVNLNGALINREELVPLAIGRSSRMIIDETNKHGYLIAERFNGMVRIIDKSGRVLFKKHFKGVRNPIIQYFSFNAQAEFIAITFPKKGFLKLFNTSGESLLPQDIPNELPVDILMHKYAQSFEIYSQKGKHLYKFQLSE